jgi:hypothetical protein
VDVTVCVATFGDLAWQTLAHERAIPSAEATGKSVLYVHGETLHDARNLALAAVDTEFVCFLDADDELEAGYFDHMAEGTADLRAPAVRYVFGGPLRGARFPRVAGHRHDCTADCLALGNWLVIGTVARTEILQRVGGFRDFPWSEDWDLWVRCWQAGATIEGIPSAIYRAHVRKDSRNRAPDLDFRMAAHRAIAEANGLPVPA